MAGFTEEHFMNDDDFKRMKRSFDSHGYTLDPNAQSASDFVGDIDAAHEKKGIYFGGDWMIRHLLDLSFSCRIMITP